MTNRGQARDRRAPRQIATPVSARQMAIHRTLAADISPQLKSDPVNRREFIRKGVHDANTALYYWGGRLGCEGDEHASPN